MNEWTLLLGLGSALYVAWLAVQLLSRPERLFGLDVAYSIGVITFPVAAWLRDVDMLDEVCSEGGGTYAMTTAVVWILGTLSLRALEPSSAAENTWGLDDAETKRPPERTWLVRFALLLSAGAVAQLHYSHPLRPWSSDVSSYQALIPTVLGVPLALLAHPLVTSVRSVASVAALLLSASALLLGATQQSRTPVTYCVLGLALQALWRIERTKASPRARVLSRYLGLLAVPAVVIGFIVLASFVKQSGGRISTGLDPIFDVSHAVATAKEQHYTDVLENTCFIQKEWGTSYAFRPFWGLYAMLVGPIPRSAWADKPRGLSYDLSLAKLGAVAVEAGNSLSPGLVGELWMNGGWWAIGIGPPLLAMLTHSLERLIARIGCTFGVRVRPALAVLWVMTVLQARGDLYTISVRGGEYLAGALLCSYLVFGRSHRPSRGRPRHNRGRRDEYRLPAQGARETA